MIKKALNIVKKPIFILVCFVVCLVAFLITRPKPPTVINTLPNDQAENILTTEIFITFNRDLDSDEQEKIVVEFTPTIVSQYFWDKNQLRILLQEDLKPNTLYKITIKFKNKTIKTFSFETSSYTREQLEEEGKLQSQGDYEFGEAFKKFISSSPWYQALPLEKSEYRIVYDFAEQSFRIRLKILPADKTQEQTLIDKALEDLKRIGVKEPISYYVLQPE